MKKEEIFLNLFSSIKKNNKTLELHEPYIDNKDLKSILNAVRNKQVAGKGNYVNLFEKKISKFTKSKYKE